MTQENQTTEQEELVNDLIAIIWPLLDRGTPKSDIQAAINNVFDAWGPLVTEVRKTVPWV